VIFPCLVDDYIGGLPWNQYQYLVFRPICHPWVLKVPAISPSSASSQTAHPPRRFEQDGRPPTASISWRKHSKRRQSSQRSQQGRPRMLHLLIWCRSLWTLCNSENGFIVCLQSRWLRVQYSVWGQVSSAALQIVPSISEVDPNNHISRLQLIVNRITAVLTNKVNVIRA